MDFGLLGPLLVRDGARPVVVSAPRQRVLLATLLCGGGRVVSAGALAEMVWDGRPPAGARGALHSAIQRLRATLGPAGAGLIGTVPPGYVLQAGGGEFDVRQFGVLAARGQAAAQAGAWPAAAGLLRQALGLWRGEALADVPSQLLRAREVPPLDDQRLAALGARIPWALGRFLDLQGLWHDWAISEQTAVAASGRLGDRAAQAFAYQRLGIARARLGSYQDAYAHLEHALSIYSDIGDTAGQANAHNTLALTLHYEGRDSEGIGHAEQALAEYRTAGDQMGQAVALNTVGWLHTRLGDHQQALRYCLQTLDLLQELGNPQLEAGTWDSLGYAHHHLGDHAESAACYQRALVLRRKIGDRWGQAETLGHIGDVRHAAGQPQEARAAWEEALAILDDLRHSDATQVRDKLAGLAAAPGT